MKMNKIMNGLEPIIIILLIPIFAGGVLPVWRAARNANSSLLYIEGNREAYEEAFAQMTSELALQQWVTMLLLFLVVLYAAVTHYRPLLKNSFIWGAGISVPAFFTTLLTQGLYFMDGGVNPTQVAYRRASRSVNVILFVLLLIAYFIAYSIQKKKGEE